ncbi:MAG TPA: MFS transporter [Candidatus Limnocylindrales bacterium]|nr:MFS transporter [Candidatus Limnocylindrales bacterium]
MPDPSDRPISDEVSPEELAHPESLAVHLGPVPAEEGGLWSPARRSLTLGLVLTITLVAAEALAVGTAAVIVARDLGGLDLYGLVFSAFLVGSLFGIVVVGGLIDRLGVVRPFVGGLALFALGLLLAGLAPSMPFLIGARLLQGVGGGAIPPVAYVAIGRSLPEHLRPRMFALLSTAWVLPGVFGPAIAGIVAEELHWRVVFLGLLPLIVVSGSIAVRALLRLPEGPAAPAGSLRTRVVEGFVVAAGVGLVTIGLSDSQPIVVAALAIPGTIVTWLAFRRLTPPGTLRLARGYPSAVLLRGVLTFAFFSVDAYVALLLVGVRGWSAAAAGIALTMATLSWTAGSWVQARLSARFGPEQFVRVGFPVVALGLAGLAAVLLPSVPAELAAPTFGVAGFGMGLAYAQFALIVLRDVDARAQGQVTSGLTLSDQVGTAVGTGVSAALIAAAVRSGAGPAPGLAVAIGIGVAFALIGFVLSPRLRHAG